MQHKDKHAYLSLNKSYIKYKAYKPMKNGDFH